MLDLKIINGHIVDGSGQPGFAADLGILGGRIVAIGDVTEAARQTIDAQGLVVAPGFVDVHTHYDAQVFWDPTLSPSCYHGVTTVFAGFCGFSIAPLTPEAGAYLMPMLARVEGMPLESLRVGVPWNWTSFGSYLDKIDGTLAINAGFMCGHSALRRVVMGERAVGSEATPDELAAMTSLLAQSIDEGAMGFSTTVSPTHNDSDGNPVPSRHASREEIIALARVCRDFEGSIVELLPGTEFSQATLDLLTDVSLAAQRPVNWNVLAITSASPAEVERANGQLAASDYARARGAEVIALTVPQTMTVRINLFSGFLFDALPGWAPLFRLPVATRLEKLADRAYRRELDEGASSGPWKAFARWGTMLIAQTFAPANKRFEGKTVADAAALLGCDVLDAFFDIAIADGLHTSFIPFTAGDDYATFAQRAQFWHDDRTVIGASDAGAHLDMIDTFAFATKVLEKGVREFGVISLEQAVHQLTQKPAQLMGLRERGLLSVGWYADITIFDPARVGCGPTYMRFDLPAQAGRLYADAIGIEHVIVNGQPIIRTGEYLGGTPGTLMRSGRDTYTVTIAASS